MIPAKVQMATKAHSAKRTFKQSNKPRLSALPSEPEMVHDHASIDSLDVLEEAMKFFLRRAIEASDEKAAKRRAPRFRGDTVTAPASGVGAVADRA